jgi:hypothetical protein
MYMVGHAIYTIQYAFMFFYKAPNVSIQFVGMFVGYGFAPVFGAENYVVQ